MLNKKSLFLLLVLVPVGEAPVDVLLDPHDGWSAVKALSLDLLAGCVLEDAVVPLLLELVVVDGLKLAGVGVVDLLEVASGEQFLVATEVFSTFLDFEVF